MKDGKILQITDLYMFEDFLCVFFIVELNGIALSKAYVAICRFLYMCIHLKS